LEKERIKRYPMLEKGQKSQTWKGADTEKKKTCIRRGRLVYIETAIDREIKVENISGGGKKQEFRGKRTKETDLSRQSWRVICGRK